MIFRPPVFFGAFHLTVALTPGSDEAAARAVGTPTATGSVSRTTLAAVVIDYAGTARLEAYTVRHGSDRHPVDAILVGLTETGERVWGNSKEPALLDALERKELLGTPIPF